MRACAARPALMTSAPPGRRFVAGRFGKLVKQSSPCFDTPMKQIGAILPLSNDDKGLSNKTAPKRVI